MGFSDIDSTRGILYPEALPRFHRREVPAASGHLTRWYWIAQWDLPADEGSLQTLLPYPAANLVAGPDGITLSGPTTSAADRELRGQGWAFGVLLRPAGLAALGVDPGEIVDTEVAFDAGGLANEVAASMSAGDCAGAAADMSAWWERQATSAQGRVPRGAVEADRIVEIVADDPRMVGVDQLARRLGMSPRALQRLTKQYIGLSPLRIIRRFRLQEAALRLRENPGLSVADVAADLGYADQSHLAADFRTTLGLAARDYRRQSRP